MRYGITLILLLAVSSAFAARHSQIEIETSETDHLAVDSLTGSEYLLGGVTDDNALVFQQVRFSNSQWRALQEKKIPLDRDGEWRVQSIKALPPGQGAFILMEAIDCDVEGECGDGMCNINEDCETCEADCGVCGECGDGQVADCADNDCCPESWIGDGFEDCEDQAYGCDLTCYDNDGGDCSSADSGESNEQKQSEALPDSRAAGARQKAPRGSEIDFPDVREIDCEGIVYLINIEFDASEDNNNSALYLKSSSESVLDKLVANNCEFDGDNLSDSYGIGHSHSDNNSGKVKDFSISNSTIKNSSTGLYVDYAGDENFIHTIGNDVSNGVEFINNSLHLDYSNFK